MHEVSTRMDIFCTNIPQTRPIIPAWLKNICVLWLKIMWHIIRCSVYLSRYCYCFSKLYNKLQRMLFLECADRLWQVEICIIVSRWRWFNSVYFYQSGRSPKVVALFSATNFSSYFIELLKLHDTILIKWNYACIHYNIAIKSHLMI